MADLEHGLTIHELELAETISGDSFVAIDDGTNTKKAKIANLNSASATSAQTYAEAAAASAASSASSATQAQTSAQSIQSAMVQATSQLQGYVDDAAASASSAAASEANIRGLITSDYAKLARSYATGDSGYREGEETDNAKYYSEQSESYVDDAAAQAVIAGQKADLSEDYAEESEDHALESEGHALGTQNGTPVSSDSPYYHNNAKYWADEARQASAGGVAASVIATAEPTNISTHAYAIGDQFVYNGILYTATSAISVGATITPGTNCSISDTITEQIGNAGHTILDEDGITYPQRSKLQFEGCEVTDDAVNGVTVVKCEGGAKKYAKPTITVGTYTYDGTTQAPTITGFDANVMTLTGTYEAINAGSYTFTIALKDKTSSKWTDDTQDDIVTNWSIGKADSNTTASASSVSLNTSNTSRTVILSNVTGTVTVSSSDTSVATASVNNNTVTITGVNHKDGSATITISIAASTNYKAKTLTVSVSASYKSTITVTLYSAASDTVSFTDDAGSKTAVTDTSGQKTSVSIVIPYNGKTITFTSSVAKNPSNLSNAYSKSIALTRSTTEIKVMPDGALYWYGNECKWITGGWSKNSYVYSGYSNVNGLTKNTNYIYLNVNSSNNTVELSGTTNAISMQDYDTVKYILCKSSDDSYISDAELNISSLSDSRYISAGAQKYSNKYWCNRITASISMTVDTNSPVYKEYANTNAVPMNLYAVLLL